MTAHRTADLTGISLAYAVAVAAGMTVIANGNLPLCGAPNRPFSYCTTAAAATTCSLSEAKCLYYHLQHRVFHPHALWADAGPLIESADISIYEDPHWNGGAVGTGRYLACQNLAIEPATKHYGSSQTGSYGHTDATFKGDNTHSGDTMLEAAMRCYVESMLGSWVEVPEVLEG